MIVELQKISLNFRIRLAEVWKDLTQVVKNFKEVPLDEINHYQILVVRNIITDKYGDSVKFQQLNA